MTKKQIKIQEAELLTVQTELDAELRQYPNVLRDDVPESLSEEDKDFQRASLDIVEKTIGNRVLEVVIGDVRDNVREGESLTGPLIKSGVFPPMVTRMIAIGEKSGKMEAMLLKISEFYDDQVDTAVEGLTSVIEPIIIGILGVVIGFIVIALFLPIINITQII